MVVKASVFRCDEGLLHQQGHLTGLQLLPRGRPQFLNHPPFTREQSDGPWSVEAGDAPCVRKGCIDQLAESHRADGRCEACSCR